MKDYFEIKSETELNELLGKIANFHDSLVKELHMINRAYVDKQRAMIMNNTLDLQLLIQSQWTDYAIEFFFTNVVKLEIDSAKEIWGGSGKFVELNSTSGLKYVHLTLDQSLVVTAESMHYRNRADWLGPKAFLTEELPRKDAIKAVLFNKVWRQCQACCNVWHCDSAIQFSLCDGCNNVTELDNQA